MVDFHYWQWNLSHKQVYGSDTESNVTLKETRVGRFSSYVERINGYKLPARRSAASYLINWHRSTRRMLRLNNILIRTRKEHEDFCAFRVM